MGHSSVGCEQTRESTLVAPFLRSPAPFSVGPVKVLGSFGLSPAAVGCVSRFMSCWSAPISASITKTPGALVLLIWDNVPRLDGTYTRPKARRNQNEGSPPSSGMLSALCCSGVRCPLC